MSEEQALKTEEKRKLQAADNWPGLLVIGIGATLLLVNLFHIQLIDWLWPGFIIAPGLMLLWPAYSSSAERQSSFAFLAVPGAMVTTVGLLLFVMNLTNHFEAWAYSWTLVIAAAAAGIVYINRFKPEARVSESGRNFIRIMVLLFGGFAIFFELVVFQNFTPWLSLALVGYGAYLLLRNRQSQVTVHN